VQHLGSTHSLDDARHRPGCRRLLEGCWFTLAAMEAAPAGAVAPGDLSRAEVLLKKAGARLFDHRTAALATAQSKPGQR
jgi:hypothetical protein